MISSIYKPLTFCWPICSRWRVPGFIISTSNHALSFFAWSLYNGSLMSYIAGRFLTSCMISYHEVVACSFKAWACFLLTPTLLYTELWEVMSLGGAEILCFGWNSRKKKYRLYFRASPNKSQWHTYTCDLVLTYVTFYGEQITLKLAKSSANSWQKVVQILSLQYTVCSSPRKDCFFSQQKLNYFLGSVHTKTQCGKPTFHAHFPNCVQNAVQLWSAAGVNIVLFDTPNAGHKCSAMSFQK